MSKIFYTYIIIDPRNNKPIYVGKGSGNRMYDHWKHMTYSSDPGNCPKLYHKLTSIFRDGYSSPKYEKLLDNIDESLALAMEVFWIAVIGRKSLCNLTDGGQGISGYKFSEESKLKIGNSQKIRLAKQGHPNSGKHWSEEVKEKIRKSNIGKCAEEKHHNCKLHLHDVLKIFFDDRKQIEIVNQYCVSDNTVRDIKKGRSWRHITSTFLCCA